MKLLSWNCRGLGNPEAVRAFHKLIHTQDPDVIFLSETRKSVTEMQRMRRRGVLANVFAVGCRGHSRGGGLCLFWREEASVQILSSSANHINFLVPMESSEMNVQFAQVTALYGFPETQNKWKTWDLIHSLKPADGSPWLCCGDFNDVLSPEDKRGGEPVNLAHLQLVHDALSECGLEDLGFFGDPYTWSNNRLLPHTINERLDFALINQSWKVSWTFSQVKHLPRYQSDHNPLLVLFDVSPSDANKVHKRQFRFEQLWLSEWSECQEVVHSVWDRGELGLAARLRALGSSLGEWGNQKFGHFKRDIRRLQERLTALQSSDRTEEVRKEIFEVEQELNELLKLEEMWWSQRSRASWLEHGDKNTQFFHRKATQRSSRNRVTKIRDDHGGCFDKQVDIARVFVEYFADLFSTSHPSRIEEATDLVRGRLSDRHRAILSSPFSRAEVCYSLKQMHPTKAPGVDGFPALFYQKFWDIVGEDVLSFVLSILNDGMSPASINHTLIALIPKVKKPGHASQFRPISLCTVIYKLVSKCIANRLKEILSDIVGEAQSAFVPDRLITDNALIAFECFHYMKKRITGKKGLMALKLDMSKAYDRVEWNFLESVMLKMGFPVCWVGLVMRCVMSVTFSVLVNGQPSSPFVPHRGLRQGDPLSPYLFILCGEVFSAMLQRAVVLKSLHGARLAHGAPIISHLFFADDSVIFTRATVEEAKVVSSILKFYEEASGQKINLEKCQLSFSRNVLSNRIDELEGLLGMKAVESYDKYLGLPTIIGKSKSQVFAFVKERVWKKLKGWKERVLSKAGREVLIKSVVQAIPAYVMSCFALPNSLCEEIERMISRFFWGGDVSTRSMHWMRWERLAKSKAVGGLGFRSFKAFNTALLAKQWWRIMTCEDSLMARVFKAIYFRRNSLHQAQLGYRPSYAWRSIFEARWVIDRGCFWKVGRGEQVQVWEDRWVPVAGDFKVVSGRNVVPMLHSVADLIDHDRVRWKEGLVRHIFSSYEASMILQIPLSLSSLNDVLVWGATHDGFYSTKSAYRFIMESEEVNGAVPSGSHGNAAVWKSVWRGRSVPRCKELAWRLCHGFLPTRVALRRRGMDVDVICPMCGEAEESLEHALFFCSTVVPVWLRSPFPLDFRDGCPAGFTFESWLLRLASLDDEWVMDVVLTMLYTVWARRNMWVFDDRWLTLEQVLVRANSMRVVPLELDIPVSAADVNRLGTGNAWQPPRVGVVKINTDASYKALEGVGLGMVARNSRGEILACASAKREGASSAAVAESLALRWAMMLAIDLGFMAVVFETDCAVLHGAWQRKGKDRSYLGSVIADCYNMLSSFRSFEFVLIRRTANKAADCLAKFAISNFCNVWLEECPALLEPILTADVNSASFD